MNWNFQHSHSMKYCNIRYAIAIFKKKIPFSFAVCSHSLVTFPFPFILACGHSGIQDSFITHISGMYQSGEFFFLVNLCFIFLVLPLSCMPLFALLLVL